MSSLVVLKKSDTIESKDVFHILDPLAPRPVSQESSSDTEPPDDPSNEGGEPSSDGAIKMQADALSVPLSKQEEIEQFSKKILAAARAEHDKILKAANDEAVKIRRTARQEAFDQVYTEKREELERTLSRVDRCLEELTNRQQSFFEGYRRDLRELSLVVAEKIMNHSLEVDPQIISDLVMQAITSVKNEEWITVEVSELLPDLVAHLKAEYAEHQTKRPVDFVSEELPRGACMVQTSSGIIDASIDTQLENLRTIFSEQGR